ncbi:MAG TPA: pitrilysin family protein [Micropepsaceae bacterium]|nr:pitrilysin family protein [Micropepsaceae bacterium]
MTKFVLALLALLVPVAANAITVKSVQGPTGVETWLSEEHALPMIAVNISFPAGSAYDPADKPGLANMTASLIDEGAGDLASDAFKQALESRAIQFGANADRDYIVVSLITLKENADEAFRLAGLAFAHPRFDAEAVERIRVAILASLKQEDEDPNRAAAKAWYAAYFGTHPYGRPQAGTPAGIAAIKAEDIKAFAAEHLVRGGIKVAVSGDITEVQLKKYLQTLFTPLPAKSGLPVPKPTDLGRPGTRNVVRNEAAPVAIFGFVGPMRADPDYIPAFVTNYILGGGSFSARLMDEVRDKRGLTYGISTQINDFRSASILVGSVQSDKTKILTALDVTKSEMARFAKDGAMANELADAKTYLTGSFPLGLDSNAKIARTLNGYQRAGLDADYVVKRNAMIQAVTLAQVNAMAKKYFDPSRLVVVIAGTPAAPQPAQKP